MALVVRCPICGCIYQVTPEDLEADNGRLRCGICQTRFDASETLRKVDDDVLDGLLNRRGSAPEPRAAETPAAQPDAARPAAFSASPASERSMPNDAQEEKRPVFSRLNSLSPKLGSVTIPTAVKRGNRLFWPIGVAVLILVILWQLLSLFGPVLGRYVPAVLSARQAVCGVIPCPGPGSEGVNPFAVENFALTPITMDSYEIHLTLANNGAESLPLPVLEVTFTDDRGLIAIRRLVKPEEYAGQGSGTRLGAAKTLPVRFAFTLSGSQPASCTVRAVPQN